ncbi:hypothetical protein [Mucilaginibacter flavus]|uniref:hypothetical protein n=1 Tax=Mucilaginibacter flavus TaxID=931504 RepID=UPI0025B5AF70|nr:hypothetical protein [Mucilaginibacter flavus]MDN3582602.1 hypothetical protein [Mucilaginibacter flavus]
MELKVEIAFDELLHVVRQLPEDKRAILKKELNKKEVRYKEGELTDFQKMLLNGPVMSDEQYKNYKDVRKHFNKWRTK